MNAAGQVLEGLLFLFTGCLWARFVVDGIHAFAPSWRPTGMVLLLLEAVLSVTDRPIQALRRALPVLRFGRLPIDLGLLALLLLSYALRAAVATIFL